MPTPSDYYDPGGQQTSVLPPTYYRPPPPPKDDNDPTKTQEAAVPRVPPPTPRTDQPPTPSAVQPPAPTPSPPGDWDHANEVPDSQRPYIRPVVGRVLPNRPPDGYSQGRPIYNLRPGEQGYSAGASPGGNWEVQNNNFAGMRNPHVPAAGGPNTNPGGWQRFATPEAGIQAISQQLDRYASGQTTGTPLRTIRQIVSTWAPPSDNNPTDTLIARASHIVGVGPDVPLNLSDPNVKAKLVEATVRNEQGGALPPTAAAGINSVFGRNTVAGSSTVAGPVQRYIPPPGREPQHWGSEPEHDWTPGRMPTQHDIPSIMGGLLPLALTLFAGAALGGGLGMVAAFSGYQNARNKGQLEAAKEQRTQFQDKLKETEAALKEELLESSGLMAEYGDDFSSPGAKMAWQALASKYQDNQLQAAIESGNSAAVQALFKKRDEAFQTIGKVGAATTKAADQEAEKQSNEAAERSTTTPDGGGGGTGVPAGSAKPWENLGPGFAGAPQVPPPTEAPSGPAGAAQPAPGGSRPAPAAAPAPAAEPPAEEPQQPEAPAAAPPAGGQPAADGQLPAPGGARKPDASLDLPVGGLGPANLPARLSPQVTGLTPERLDQDARQYLETQKDPYKGGPSGDPLAIKRNEAVRVRASQMQSFIDRVIATTPPGQIDSALQKIDTVDPGLAAVARVVDRGDSAPPTGWQLRSPFYQTINKLVTSLDPSWDATRWVTNYRTKAGFATGTQSNQVASANRALQHMTVLYNAAAMLQNQDYPTYNAFINALRTAGGDDAVTSFTIARMHVAQELEKVFRGSSGAASEIKADIDTVNSSASPQQIKGYIRTTTELLKGQLDALADLYSRGTHKKITGEDLLSPEGRATYERMIKLPIDETALQPKWTNKIVEPHLDETATLPPESQSGPGPAPVEIPQGWVEQPQQ